MATSWEGLNNRIREKKVAEDRDLDLYWASNERHGIFVNGFGFPLLSTDDLSERREVVSPAAPFHWKDEGPDCEGTPDHNLDHLSWQTSVKHQRDRATCVSFACLAGIESIVRRDGGGAVNLSEQFANWMFDYDLCLDRVRTSVAARRLTSQGVCIERLAKYENRDTVTSHCESEPSDMAKKNARYGIGVHHEIYRLEGDEEFSGPSIANVDYLECLLVHGHDIVFATEVAWGMDGDKVHDVLRDPGDGSRPRFTGGAHVMLMVGYDRRVEPGFFLFKNSFGKKAGMQGYYKLSYDYVQVYSIFGVVIEKVRTDMPV